LQRNVNKGKENGAARGALRAYEVFVVPSGRGAPSGLALQLAYFSGVARLLEARRGGLGAIVRLQRVRPTGAIASSR